MPDTPTELDILRAHRGVVTGHVARLAAERARVAHVDDAERQARADLDALGREEVDAVRAWAALAATDPAPQPDAERRHRLTIALATAEAASAAARRAGAAIDADLGEAQQEVVRLGRQIEATALDTLSATFLDRWADVSQSATVLRGKLAEAFACLAFLRAMAEEHVNRGRHAEALALRRRIEPLSSDLAFDLHPTNGETNSHVPAWAALFADLTR